MNHIPFIHCCLELAKRGHGKTGINPLVGAVLVRRDEVIAEAFHEGYGLTHAERRLLTEFEGNIESQDTLYINIEPCCHHGKTPPCTDTIIESGVKRVVYGMEDPNSNVMGKGIETLKNAGIEVYGPVIPELCKRLNRGFVSLHTNGRPWITLKIARTRAGAFAKADGSPLKITSKQQDEWSHKNLRATHDAILVGVNTVKKDDPQLTVRYKNKNVEQLNPLRIMLDPNLSIPMNAQVVVGIFAGGTALIVGKDKKEKKEKPFDRAQGKQEKKDELIKRGVRIFEVQVGSGGVFNWQELWNVLTTPKGNFYGIKSILVEGGPGTWQRFKEAGMVDEEVVLVGN